LKFKLERHALQNDVALKIIINEKTTQPMCQGRVPTPNLIHNNKKVILPRIHSKNDQRDVRVAMS
jgi:hypothetical protein